MRYVDKDLNHDYRLTRDVDEVEPISPEPYGDFLDRRLKDEAYLDFPAPYSFSQVLQ
ncbi:hypothetical protein [Paraburkholderia rhynchosiae]|uniref:Uncharacterized protein n=1 Tax=Paraburkholderia rhynchosiae TaxID=487049 RepID=A0A6J5C8M8_9BURK|nr:hypothetical protein [Paraburkholderia rhynchosiae]CAB3730570.1 hypothetical protein LMG27174_05757 [Paraburkholderia rhynchosiae]